MGNFACILFEKKSKLLHLYLSITGQIPAYIISQGDQIFITSRLSAFHRTDLFNRQLIPIRQYQYAFTDKTPLDFSLMQQCKRAIPGILYSFSTGKKPELTGQAILKQIAPGRINMDKKAAQEKLQELLYDHIRQTAVAGQAVAVPVSGGVDSGTIAGILKNEKTDLHTYSIGTEFGNEFPAARITADFCGSIHVEITLDDADFVEGLLHSVYYNEIFDPLYAEGFVAFYQVLKQASGVAGIIYTGYGADLVMGNILKEKDIQKIQQANASWCRRTSWTGELSPYLPAIFNSELHYPFWSEDMIDLGLSMPP
jgi:asparagine synthetase B (glutamine-hydrolysing)